MNCQRRTKLSAEYVEYVSFDSNQVLNSIVITHNYSIFISIEFTTKPKQIAIDKSHSNQKVKRKL